MKLKSSQCSLYLTSGEEDEIQANGSQRLSPVAMCMGCHKLGVCRGPTCFVFKHWVDMQFAFSLSLALVFLLPLVLVIFVLVILGSGKCILSVRVIVAAFRVTMETCTLGLNDVWAGPRMELGTFPRLIYW